MSNPIEQITSELSNIRKMASQLSKRAERLQVDLESHYKALTRKAEHPEWMNKSQVGRYTGTSYRTVLRWQQQGRLLFEENGKIHRTHVDDFLRNNDPRRARKLGLMSQSGVLR